MAREFKLSYTGSQINEKLSKIDNLALKSELPTKTSDLTNNSGFLTSIPSEYVTETELNNKGYLTQHQDISGKLDASELPTAINTALAQAKESGEFDGKDGTDGKTPVKGKDYFTDADKSEMISSVIASLPIYNGEVVSV